MAKTGLIQDSNGAVRCWWAGQQPDYCVYHDEEWGRPTFDDRRLFEKICLEGFQSGLSWLTILRKRENFRKAFAGFDFEKVSRFNTRSVDRLMQDAGIVRHRGKIESTINNAKRAREIVDEFGALANYVWQWQPDPKSRPKRITHAAMMKITNNEESTALSKDLKKRGWSYVGPTTTYAFMQAMGMVNDHLEGCKTREEVEKLRKKLPPIQPKRPS